MQTLALKPPAALLRLSDVMLLLVAMVWGSSYGMAKSALAFYPVLGLLAVRFLLTFCLLLPSLLKASPAERRNAIRAGLPLGGLLLGIFLCETYGVALTQAANAAFLISLCVVFTPFAEWQILGRRPGRAAFLFAVVSLLGAALLSGSIQARFGLGDALMLAAAVLRAIIVCLTSRLSRQHPAPALALTAVQGGILGFACLLIASLSTHGLPPLPTAPAFWLATLYLVLGCTIFAFFAQNWALKHSSPSRVALLTGSEPVFGALFAVAFLGETLSGWAWLGGGLIVTAALLATLRPPPQAISA